MTLAHAEQCSEATARALTDQLRQSLTISWDLLVEAYQRRAWAALGYATWDAYTDAELGATRLRIPREQRREVVASMTEAGMSTRAIGSALGINDRTVRRDADAANAARDEPVDAEIVDESDDLADHLAQSDANYARQAAEIEAQLREERDAPEPCTDEDEIPAGERRSILGTDGKTYSVQPKPQRRRPLPDAFRDATYDLKKVTERIGRLADDDRFPRNADEVAAANRSDLIRAIDALQDVANRLPAA